jgi:hypothetical protein
VQKEKRPWKIITVLKPKSERRRITLPDIDLLCSCKNGNKVALMEGVRNSYTDQWKKINEKRRNGST